MSTLIPAVPSVLSSIQASEGVISFDSGLIGDKTLFKVRVYSQKVTEHEVTILLSLEWCQDFNGNILSSDQRKALGESGYTFVGARVNGRWAIGDLNEDQLTAIKHYAARDAEGRGKAKLAKETYKPANRWAYVEEGKVLGVKIDFTNLYQPAKKDGAKAAPNPYYAITGLDLSALVFQGTEAPSKVVESVQGSATGAGKLAGMLGASVSVSAESLAPQTPASAVATGNPFLK